MLNRIGVIVLVMLLPPALIFIISNRYAAWLLSFSWLTSLAAAIYFWAIPGMLLLASTTLISGVLADQRER